MPATCWWPKGWRQKRCCTRSKAWVSPTCRATCWGGRPPCQSWPIDLPQRTSAPSAQRNASGSVLARAPDGKNDPHAVEKRDQESDKSEKGQAEELRPPLHRHDDAGPHHQRGGQDAHGQ